jgi:hypothetical protein
MKPLLTALLLAPLACLGSFASAQDYLEIAANPGGAGQGKSVVLVAGDELYRTEETMPMLAKILSQKHGFKTTVLFAINPDGGYIDANFQNNIPGTEALDSADLLIIGTRFRQLPDDQLARFAKYLDAGNPVKAAHPDWLIRSWWWQGFWNYAVKEVRDYRLSIVREVAEQYDFDGVHLDFLRHTPFLPPGKQWENREHLNRFMQEVRLMLQSQAAKRGRPFMLAARVPDSVEGCHTDGLDIETWAREGLVDVFILGTRTINVDVASFRKAMAGAQVKLMPSFDCFHATDGYHGDQSLDLVCGVFGNYLHQGADGVGTFNGIIGSPELAKKLGLTQTDTRDLQVFSTIGSLATMSGKARYYPIDRSGGYAHNEGYGSSNDDAPLPIRIEERSSAFHAHTSNLGVSEIGHRSATATTAVPAHGER